MAYYSLEDLNRVLTPPTGRSDVDPKTPESIVCDCLLNPQGVQFSFEEMKTKIENTLKKSPEVNKVQLSKKFQVLGPTKRLELEDSAYWSGVRGTKEIISGDDETKRDVLVAVVRDQYISPSTVNTDKIGLFINNMPSIVVSQMVPYLEVEFDYNYGENLPKYTRTPGVLRFLLGSVDSLSANDKIIKEALEGTLDTARGSQKISTMGLEAFLMPQTLTNMNSLKAGSQRLVDSKPFLPLASLEGFDITVQNAGAGTFAANRGVLKIKIHDKSRISEFSEFLRGAAGVSGITVKTTIGWRAPENRGADDEYAKFINTFMRRTDRWAVINTQFSFDVTGQVNIGIQLASNPYTNQQAITVASGTSKELEDWDNMIKFLQDIRGKITSNQTVGLTSAAEQLIKSSADDKVYVVEKGKGKKAVSLETALEGLKASLNAAVAAKQISENDKETCINYINKINTAVFDPKTKKKMSVTTKDLVVKSASENANKKFFNLSATPDPFLARATANEYFNDSLIKAVEEAKKPPPPITVVAKGATGARTGAAAARAPGATGAAAAQAQPAATGATGAATKGTPGGGKATPKSKTSAPPKVIPEVVSFGKLFVNFANAIAQKDEELQVIFYGANSSSGPMGNTAKTKSGAAASPGERVGIQSLAEFPIDVLLLKKAFEARVRATRSDALTIEEFLQLVIETNFSRQDGIGYGRRSFLKTDPPVGKEAAKSVQKAEKEAEAAQWLKTFGQLKLPTLEMQMENIGVSPSGKKIRRIHIYDRNLIPYVNLDNSDTIEKKKEQLRSGVPSIQIGSNGSLVVNSTLASKTDGVQGTIYLLRAMQSQVIKTGDSASGLSESDSTSMPIRTLPVQMTLQTFGVPCAKLYQMFFVDFGTDTTLDNLYVCTQVQHNITQGKFMTNWTFAYANGYGQFTPVIAPQELNDTSSLQGTDATKAPTPQKKKSSKIVKKKT